jgi:hypothetical protein
MSVREMCENAEFSTLDSGLCRYKSRHSAFMVRSRKGNPMDDGLIEKVARAIRRRRIDLLGHRPAPDDMLDLSAEDVAFARAAIDAYEKATRRDVAIPDWVKKAADLL